MAVYFEPKPSAGVVTYKWAVPLAETDDIASGTVVLLAGPAVVDSYEVDGPYISFTVSGGTSGAVTSFTGTAITSLGDTIKDTLYIPVFNEVNLGATGQDIANYILRKVNGLGGSPDANQAEDVFERLTDMLLTWRMTGFDLGITLPVVSTTVFNTEDAYVAAIKANGILAIADLYGIDVSPVVIQQARVGLQLIKQSMFDGRTANTVYY